MCSSPQCQRGASTEEQGGISPPPPSVIAGGGSLSMEAGQLVFVAVWCVGRVDIDTCVTWPFTPRSLRCMALRSSGSTSLARAPSRSLSTRAGACFGESLGGPTAPRSSCPHALPSATRSAIASQSTMAASDVTRPVVMLRFALVEVEYAGRWRRAPRAQRSVLGVARRTMHLPWRALAFTDSEVERCPLPVWRYPADARRWRRLASLPAQLKKLPRIGAPLPVRLLQRP